MIAKSDVVILVVSVTLLAAGIYRWQSNMSQSQLRHTTASSPAASQRDDQQPASTSSSAASQNTAPAKVMTEITPAAGSEINASVVSNFGNDDQVRTVQPSTQSAAVSTGKTANSASQSGDGKGAREPLYGNYEVEPGDSLSRIAINFGTTVDTLREINDINGTLITIGQNLLYPLPAN